MHRTTILLPQALKLRVDVETLAMAAQSGRNPLPPHLQLVDRAGGTFVGGHALR